MLKFFQSIIDTQKVVSNTERLWAISIEYAPKLASALVILFAGLYAIKILNRVLRRVMSERKIDLTLSKFLADMLNWTLKILLFVMFISKLGIETSSFVAILGAMGLAVGLSLQGSLSNFAGGVIIILFKPFRVGDLIEVQTHLGTVLEIQIFVTKILTANNSTVFIPNGTLSNGTITNHSTAGKRRIDILMTLPYGTDIQEVRKTVLDILTNNEHVLQSPEPALDVLAMTDTAIKMAIRPWVLIEHYSSVSGSLLEHCLQQLSDKNIEIQPAGK